MNLILQGPDATLDSMQRIAALAGPRRMLPIGERALRAEGIDDSAALRRTIMLAADAAHLDATFIAPGRTLADFRLLAMDMDSTLITIECIDEIADMQGLKPQVAAITEAAMRGEIEFAESLSRRVALLAGLDASALQRVYDERLALSPGAQALLSAARAAGLSTLLVSGGFTFFTERLASRLGIDHTAANVLEQAGGRLTGRIAGDILDALGKKRSVERVCAQLGTSPRQAIVMGDGANDLHMMGIAGLSVAYRAKPVVREQADVALTYSGLDGLLAVLAP